MKWFLTAAVALGATMWSAREGKAQDATVPTPSSEAVVTTTDASVQFVNWPYRRYSGYRYPYYSYYSPYRYSYRPYAYYPYGYGYHSYSYYPYRSYSYPRYYSYRYPYGYRYYRPGISFRFGW